MKNLLLVLSLMLNLVFILGAAGFLYQKGGVSYLSKVVSSFNNKQQSPNPYYSDKKELFERLPHEKGNVVFLGDSLTDYNEWSEMFQNEQIVNRGIGKDTTEGMLNRLSEITESAPSKVFIMGGINDLDQDVGRSMIISNFEKMLNLIRKDSPKTEVYVQSVLPINNSVSGSKIKSDAIISLNRDLKILAEREGYFYVDLFSLFADGGNQLNSKFTTDGVHLRGDAYLIWKNKIKQYID